MILVDSEALLQQALELPSDARAKLANRLIESLDDLTPDSNVEEAWALEIKKRVAELDAGSVKTIPAAEFLSEMRDAARGQNR